MKKMVFGFAVLMILAVAAAKFAAGIDNIRTGQKYLSVASQLTSQGTHCSGTMGCSCAGFAPITNGDVWQQAYCKHCGHKKSCHK